MAYTVNSLVEDVRKLLDEAAIDDSGFTADGASGTTVADDTELDELIESRIVDARNFVLGGCDVGLLHDDCETLNDTEVPGTPFVIGSAYKGLSISLQSKAVLRLVSVRGNGWSRAVSEFVSMDSPEYSMLKDEITTGIPEYPAAAEAYDNTGVRYLELYSWKVAAESQGYFLRYVREYALTDLTNDVKVNSEVLRGALRYYLAGLVAVTLGDARGDNFMHLATAQMGVAQGTEGR